MKTYAVKTVTELHLPTLGWLADGRQVVQTSATHLERCHDVVAYEQVAECESGNQNVLTCEGECEINYVRVVS